MPRRRVVVEDSDTAEQSSTSDEMEAEDEHFDRPAASKSMEFPLEDVGVAGPAKTERKPVKAIVMICDALLSLDEKKGSTPQAVRTWILSKHTELPEKRFKTVFRRAFLKGIEDGVLQRTNATKKSAGLTGRVMLPPVKSQPARKLERPAPTKATNEEAGEHSAPAVPKPAPKPAPKPKAPRKVKAPAPQDANDAEQVPAPKAKPGRPRKKLGDDNEGVDDHPEKPKAKVGRKKASPPVPEAARHPK